MDDMQVAMSVAISKEALDFEAGMNAALINGSIQKSAEMAQNMARISALQAEGIGVNLDVTV